MKPLYIVGGFLCIALGLIGIPTPGLPTTPFLLLAMYFFGKGSPRLQQWFMGTKIYHKYLKEYDEKRALTLKRKISISLISTTFCAFAIFTIPHIAGKIAVALLLVVQYWYFFYKMPTLDT